MGLLLEQSGINWKATVTPKDGHICSPHLVVIFFTAVFYTSQKKVKKIKVVQVQNKNPCQLFFKFTYFSFDRET